MTKEEIIKGLHFTVGTFLVDPLTGEERDEESLNNLDKTAVNACSGAIKILEQKPVLDKIRAEIIDTGAYEQETKGRTEFLEGINYCLGVIDKYKVESGG